MCPPSWDLRPLRNIIGNFHLKQIYSTAEKSFSSDIQLTYPPKISQRYNNERSARYLDLSELSLKPEKDPDTNTWTATLSFDYFLILLIIFRLERIPNTFKNKWKPSNRRPYELHNFLHYMMAIRLLKEKKRQILFYKNNFQSFRSIFLSHLDRYLRNN